MYMAEKRENPVLFVSGSVDKVRVGNEHRECLYIALSLLLSRSPSLPLVLWVFVMPGTPIPTLSLLLA